ncbi:hypothetical protein RvY_17328 [Ramazzottius varieornatus]|uniref:GRAM domain-containing protein n=1 Tax=Ramazzottius varieornatus TaxID=947166 RepID=A0A1D1W1S3_RAMVA|nr:hypothetical protein RvY_17328 [Ramazzottius varieornatus]
MFKGAIRSEMEEYDHFSPSQQLDYPPKVDSSGRTIVMGDRDAKFRSRFPEIAAYEYLQKFIPCVWRKDHSSRSLRGGLYLTENHIGFYCASKAGKLKEDERRLLIEIVTVTQVSKTRSMNVFPDSITIETAGGGRYVFAQIFSRNVVYKAICDLCGIQPTVDSRRGSLDPSAFGDMDDDRSSLDRQSLPNEKDRSASSSTSSTTPPDVRRMLSVVPEHEHTESGQPEVTSGQFHTPHVSRMNSRIEQHVVDIETDRALDTDEGIGLVTEPETSVIGQRIIWLLRVIAGLLVFTALVSVYRIVVSPAQPPLLNAGDDFMASFGEAKHATQALMGVAQRAQTFLQAVCDAHVQGKPAVS